MRAQLCGSCPLVSSPFKSPIGGRCPVSYTTKLGNRSRRFFWVSGMSPPFSRPTRNAEARAQLSDLRRLAERTVAVVRDMSLLLRPSMLDDLGLIPAVQWQAREVSRTSNISVHVNAESVREDLGDEHRTCIYRVVQEALRNVVRHARATNARVRLYQSGDELVLTIQDDGSGFVPEREKGLGLLGMEERVTHLHGRFRVESTPGAGTSVRVELPLSESVGTAGR